MHSSKFDFKSLKKASFGEDANWLTTFAYWIGILNDPDSEFANNADESCSVMSYQYDREEQACDLDDLRSYPDIIPSVFIPVSPVTLAHSWSPFPDAFNILGNPITTHQADYGEVLSVFRPIESPQYNPTTPDEFHFKHLLDYACMKAFKSKRWVMITGSPGWSYDSEDFIYENHEIQNLMIKFGYITTLRRPKNA